MEEIITYKCPNCASNIFFNTEFDDIECGHCGSRYTKERFEELCEISTKKFITARCYRCNGCGAQVISDNFTSSSTCAYCGSNLIVKDKLTNTLKPDKIIPFKISYNEARAIALKKLNQKNIFCDCQITGIYVPYWLYDFYSYVNLINSNAKYIMNFSHVPIDASVKINDDLACAIEPFDYKELKDFSPMYLAGFVSERYSDEKYVSFDKVMSRMNTDIPFVLNEVYGMILDEKEYFVENRKDEKQYVLLPLWVASYTINAEKHNCYINGQTGKCIDEFDDINQGGAEQDIHKSKIAHESGSGNSVLKIIALIILIVLFTIAITGAISMGIIIIWLATKSPLLAAGVITILGVFILIGFITKLLMNMQEKLKKNKTVKVLKNKYKRTGRYVVDVGRVKK